MNENITAALCFYRELHFRDHQNSLRADITFANECQKGAFTADIYFEVSGYNPHLAILVPADITTEVVPVGYRVGYDTWHFDSIARSLSIEGTHPTHGKYKTTFKIVQ